MFSGFVRFNSQVQLPLLDSLIFPKRGSPLQIGLSLSSLYNIHFQDVPLLTLTKCHKYICEKNVWTSKANVFLWCPLLYCCRKQPLHQSSKTQLPK